MVYVRCYVCMYVYVCIMYVCMCVYYVCMYYVCMCVCVCMCIRVCVTKVMPLAGVRVPIAQFSCPNKYLPTAYCSLSAFFNGLQFVKLLSVPNGKWMPVYVPAIYCVHSRYCIYAPGILKPPPSHKDRTVIPQKQR